jgi:hypothetical protein
MNRSTRIGTAIVAGLGLFVFALLLVGSIGEPRDELQRLSVSDVLDGPPPAERFGTNELRVTGWYAELDADCDATGQPPALTVPWLERSCPLRVLMPYQPTLDVTQADLLAAGLRLAAPNGKPFPSRATPEGPNLRLEPLVYVGHFDDPAAQQCAPTLVAQCRSTFVVSDYTGLIR